MWVYLSIRQNSCRKIQGTHEDPSHIHDLYKTAGHAISIDNFNIMGREEQITARSIKEAFLIRVIVPSLNKNIGEKLTVTLRAKVVVNPPELKLK